MIGNSRFSGMMIPFALIATLVAGTAMGSPAINSMEQRLGRLIYFDKGLSNPEGQSCASCHLPSAGYADPDQGLPVSEGAVSGRYGSRNAPSSAYAAFSPGFTYDPKTGAYEGGQFWDGRAKTLEEQAMGPFLNPLEMNNTKEGVVQGVRDSHYASLFKEVFGEDSLEDVDSAYELIARAIADFERSPQVNRFTSKYDYYLKGKVELTPQEKRGLDIFNGKGNCSSCHPSTPDSGATRPLFTTFGYDNVGVPRNMEFPFYLMEPTPYPDPGLGNTVSDPMQHGKFKVMTLRNIALTAPYSHNGYFKSLKEIVHFFNTRDVVGLWPPPDVPENINSSELGNLGLTLQEEDDVVAFLLALTDGYLCK